jgi:hypothetical protein
LERRNAPDEDVLGLGYKACTTVPGSNVAARSNGSDLDVGNILVRNRSS